MNISATDLLTRLQNWYVNECNNDWEHSYGIRIDTLDNPGWIVTVDLIETEWSSLELNRVICERSERDWVQYEIVNSQFIGCCGPQNLSEVLTHFLGIVESNKASVGCAK